MFVVTTPYIPGYKIRKIIGPVYGMSIRTRGLGGQIAATLESIIGGEITAYIEEASKARRESIRRMIEMAQKLGANAIIAVDFETSDILNGTATMFSCYGTAVIVEKIESGKTSIEDYLEIFIKKIEPLNREKYLNLEEIYERLIKRYEKIYGVRTASFILEKEIEKLQKQGLSREEAIKKLYTR